MAYAKSVGGLCEICLANGVYTPGEIVHHKNHISPETIDDPTVTLDWRNLELVCRECHRKLHEDEINKKKQKRYFVDNFGRVTAKEEAPPIQIFDNGHGRPRRGPQKKEIARDTPKWEGKSKIKAE